MYVIPKTIPELSPKAISRFWLKVSKSEKCWEWQASTSSGYGTFRIDGKGYGAHRISAFLAGCLTDQSLLVCHKCDNPPCVRPSHLFAGSPHDNTMDAYRKGRVSPPAVRGESNHGCELSDDAVRAAIEMHRRGVPQVEIARSIGARPSAVWRWVNGKDRNEATGMPRIAS